MPGLVSHREVAPALSQKVIRAPRRGARGRAESSFRRRVLKNVIHDTGTLILRSRLMPALSSRAFRLVSFMVRRAPASGPAFTRR